MGFAKAFEYGNFSQLTKEISTPMGLVWFVTAILFIICIALYLLQKDSWVYFALVAVVLSQILIINNWQDACKCHHFDSFNHWVFSNKIQK
jgi:hypothetical protein